MTLDECIARARAVAGERVLVEILIEPDESFRCQITGQETKRWGEIQHRCPTPTDAFRAALDGWIHQFGSRAPATPGARSRIRERLEVPGVGIGTVAREAGVSQASLVQWLRGKREAIDLAVLGRLDAYDRGPGDEQLAALAEGGVTGGRRDELLAHLAGSEEDYDVFTDTVEVLGALEEEDDA
ncbi:MAG TPA: helix-turn-helix transcriptional regulator [Longimicrobium sp.]|nr:helix-turn-helix transcriptional regulator [Longimicrobium sp.]